MAIKVKEATNMKTHKSAHARHGKKSRRIQFIILCVLVPFFVMPFYVMIMAALKTPQYADVTTMWLPPSPFSLDGLQEAWGKLSPNLMNSFTMVIPAVVISSAIGSFNGYLLSKFTFRFSSVMFTMMLVGMFIPYQSVLIPLVKFLQLVNQTFLIKIFISINSSFVASRVAFFPIAQTGS